MAYTDNPIVRAATHYLFLKNVQRVYTQEEVDALIQFYNTPVGKRIVEKMPSYITATMVVSMNMVKDRMIDFQRQRRCAFEVNCVRFFVTVIMIASLVESKKHG